MAVRRAPPRPVPGVPIVREEFVPISEDPSREGALRLAKSQLDSEQSLRRSAEVAALVAAERARAAEERAERLSRVQPETRVEVESGRPDSPKREGISIRTRAGRVTITGGLVTVLLSGVKIGAEQWLELRREVTAQRALVTNLTTTVTTLESEKQECRRDVMALALTMSKLSGYVGGGLEAAGVSTPVPKGGSVIDVRPVRLRGQDRPSSVKLETPVPTPPEDLVKKPR